MESARHPFPVSSTARNIGEQKAKVKSFRNRVVGQFPECDLSRATVDTQEIFSGIDCAERQQLGNRLRARRILVIVGIGTFLISSELLVFRSLNHFLDGFTHGMGTLVQRATVVVDVVSAASKLIPHPAAANTHFQWDWKDSQELKADQSLRNAKLTEHQRDAIAEQLRPMVADLGFEFESESELRKAARDTRIKMIDLNGDGVPEVVAQGMIGCGATGNCPFWVLRKAKQRYELILDGEAQTFTIQKSSSNGFRDIVLSRHGSYSSGDLSHYQFHEGAYQKMGCYAYDWTVLEGEKVRDLKEAHITPCNQRKNVRVLRSPTYHSASIARFRDMMIP